MSVIACEAWEQSATADEFIKLGAGITDQDRNILSNQHLLLRTFRSVASHLTTGPPKAISSIPGSSKGRKRKRREGGESDDEANKPSENDLEIPVDGATEDSELDALAGTPLGTELTSPDTQGSILITLLDQPPYTLWNLPKLATRPPPLCPGTSLPQPRYALLRSFEFRPDLWPGYEHRRTLGFKEGLSKGDNKEIKGRRGRARTWELVLRQEDDLD